MTLASTSLTSPGAHGESIKLVWNRHARRVPVADSVQITALRQPLTNPAADAQVPRAGVAALRWRAADYTARCADGWWTAAMRVMEDSSGVSRVQVVVRVRPVMPHDSGDSSAVTCNDERTQVQVRPSLAHPSPVPATCTCQCGPSS